MRIDDLQRSTATQGTEKTDLTAPKGASGQSSAAPGGDTAEVSELAQSLSLKDPQRIEQLRRAVQSGTYTVSASEVARAILDAHITYKP